MEMRLTATPGRNAPPPPGGEEGGGARAGSGHEAIGMRPRRERLDVTIVARGLEPSRERARRLIVAGEVTVDGTRATAPSMLVSPEATIEIGRAMPYVGRGGIKLAHALDAFAINPDGAVAIDVGASTGGFTDVLLRRGAARVHAVDVGHGQLAWTLRTDPRVDVREGVNARDLDVGAASAACVPAAAGIVVVDVAFISLRHVLPAIARVLGTRGDVVALVKPQFEAGPRDVGKGGIVRDPRTWQRVLLDVATAAATVGLHPAGLVASPVRGQAGNVEFLLWLRRPADETRGVDAERSAERSHDEPDNGAYANLVTAAIAQIPRASSRRTAGRAKV
jgi:23S rRNA (cytidine1920-2'-O)/16S rRNA (cytidine1409-2'-O)-methyltransferase